MELGEAEQCRRQYNNSATAAGDMWHRLEVFGALLFVLRSVEGSSYRIIAGRKASVMEFPYQAEVERYGRHWCGGSIIHRSFVLTASHCVKDYESMKPVPQNVMKVRVGNDESLKGGVVHEIREVIPHEKFKNNAEMDQYDIALLRLGTPVELSERVALIKLSTVTPEAGEMGWVTGFGRQEMMRRSLTGSKHLMAVELPVISLEACRRKLRNVADDMICAGFKKGHRDSCTGDSGGPYVVNEVLTGIVAWGIGCGREGMPGVYTNVALYKNWVENKMEEYNEGSMV